MDGALLIGRNGGTPDELRDARTSNNSRRIVTSRSDGNCDINVLHLSCGVRNASYAAAGSPGKEDMEMAKVEVSNEELRTVRDAMRELNRMVDSLERGDSTKYVLTQRNQMRAVVLSLEAYSVLQRGQSEQQAAA